MASSVYFINASGFYYNRKCVALSEEKKQQKTVVTESGQPAQVIQTIVERTSYDLDNLNLFVV